MFYLCVSFTTSMIVLALILCLVIFNYDEWICGSKIRLKDKFSHLRMIDENLDRVGKRISLYLMSQLLLIVPFVSSFMGGLLYRILLALRDFL